MHTNKNVSIGVNLQIKEKSLGLFLNYYKDEIIWFPEMSKPTPTNNMYKEIVFFWFLSAKWESLKDITIIRGWQKVYMVCDQGQN